MVSPRCGSTRSSPRLATKPDEPVPGDERRSARPVRRRGAARIRELLRGAELVTTSRLTLAEAGRVLARLRITTPALAATLASREADFAAESDLWAVAPIDEDVLARCARPFPVEPVRTFDAIHLATLEKLSSSVPRLVVVSTDDRLRTNAGALGFEVAP
ncbi:MAG: type II toxin-antitoxin system VapC family toxin [Deltaproteobacteria bacterium]|nr:type II toxin-antitoxin system VapC family toxin [Deltaproteobacteria bacterium]